MTPRVGVVVLTWNGREDTLGCLRSLESATYPSFFAVVVDNGSADGTVGALAEAFPDVRVIALGETPALPASPRNDSRAAACGLSRMKRAARWSCGGKPSKRSSMRCQVSRRGTGHSLETIVAS